MPASGQAVSLWEAIQLLPRRGPPAGFREGPDQSSILDRLALLVPGATSTAAAAGVNGEGHGGEVELAAQSAEVELPVAEPDGEASPSTEGSAETSNPDTTALQPAGTDPAGTGEPDIAMSVSDTPDAAPSGSLTDEFAPEAPAIELDAPPPLPALQADPFAAIPEPEAHDAFAADPPAALDGVLSPPVPVEPDWPGELIAEDDDREDAPDGGHDPAQPETAAQEPQEHTGDDAMEPVAGPGAAVETDGPDAGFAALAASSEGADAGALPPPVGAPAAEPASDATARQFLSYLVHPAGSRTSACDVAAVCRALGGADLDVEPLPLADAFGDNALALTVNGKTIIAMTIDSPLPADVLLRGDPQAIAAARAGAAHTVLALIEPVDGQPDALDGATAMTTVLSAMASVLPAEAAVFTSSGVCATVATLNACAHELGHGQAPVRLWFEVSLHLALPGADQRLRLAATTNGLAAFIGREIEFAAASIGRRELRRRILALSAHLAVNGFAMSGGVNGDAAAVPSITARFLERGDLVAGPALVLSLADDAAGDA
jgi:hypothetical protein